jgi:putative transposase
VTPCHEEDYEAFATLIERACQRLPMRVLAYCLMPNHFHLVLWPYGDGDLGRWMHWLLTSHVRRHHRRYGTQGHVWQGRFKAFPIQQDNHLLAVLRYVERNPLRAGMVDRAEEWPWSSLRSWSAVRRAAFLNEGPLARPQRWPAYVNQPQTEAELEAVRLCVKRGAPWGDPQWARQAARRLGLEFTLRPRGRPRTQQQKK